MSIPPDRIRIPEEFISTGDPVQQNPFGAHDFRYAIWEKETEVAGEKVFKIRQQSLESARSFDAETGDLSSAHAWLLTLTVEKFDAWAERNLRVIWFDSQLRPFDRWLLDYANRWLDVLSQFLDSTPPSSSAGELLAEGRKRFSGRVRFWQLLARKYRDEQRGSESLDLGNEKPPVSPELKKRRRRLVAQFRKAHELTAAGLAHRAGMSESGVLGIVNEDKTRFALLTQERLLAVLKVSRDEWYRT